MSSYTRTTTVTSYKPTLTFLRSICRDAVEGKDGDTWRDATEGERLAICILAGDSDAALVLADEVQERHARPEGFVGREELVDMLREMEWQRDGQFDMVCPVCEALQGGAHNATCKFALAIGARRER